MTRISPIKSLNPAMSPGFGGETTDGAPIVKGHAVPNLAFGYSGLAKALALGKSAIEDVQSCLTASTAPRRTGLIVLLSDRFLFGYEKNSEGNYESIELRLDWQNRTKDFSRMLAERAQLQCLDEYTSTVYGGHSDAASAIIKACLWIDSGEVDRCIVGGIDSFVDVEVIEQCDRLGILKTDGNPVGFIPGEAACFLSIERSQQGQNTPAISGVALGADTNHQFTEQPPLGRGMAETIGQVCRHDSTSPDFLACDLNGLERRAYDWGHAMVHLHERFNDKPQLLPAVAFGEVGAATGFMSCGFVSHLLRRTRPTHHSGLVCLASDDEKRAAILIDNARASAELH